MSEFQFKCVSCGETHVGIPAFGAEAPQPYFALPESERQTRAELSSDQCIIDRKHFFIRGCLDLPIHGHSEVLSWGVWVSLNEASFERVNALWEADGREREPPMFGWLATAIPGYPPTVQLKTNVRLRPRGARPFIELEPSDHPLSVDQREGVPVARLELLIDRALHGALNPLAESVRAAFEAQWGPSDNVVVFDALLHARPPYPPLPRVDVFVWRAEDDSDVTSFLTCGMASRPMPGVAAKRAELHFGIRQKLSADQEHAVAKLLANLACYPWASGKAALGFWHTLAASIPIPGFPSCRGFLLHPRMTEQSIDQVHTEAGHVDVLLALPITEDEHALVRERGVDALLDRWDAEQVDVFVDRRPPR